MTDRVDGEIDKSRVTGNSSPLNCRCIYIYIIRGENRATIREESVFQPFSKRECIRISGSLGKSKRKKKRRRRREEGKLGYGTRREEAAARKFIRKLSQFKCSRCFNQAARVAARAHLHTRPLCTHPSRDYFLPSPPRLDFHRLPYLFSPATTDSRVGLNIKGRRDPSSSFHRRTPSKQTLSFNPGISNFFLAYV